VVPDERIAGMGKVGKFLAAIVSGWGSTLSGALSVPFTVLAFVASTHGQKVAYASIALVAGITTAYQIWARENQKVQTLEDRLRAIEDAKPNIVLREPGAKHTQDVRFMALGFNDVTLTFIKARFINTKKVDGPTAEAKGIRAKITFLDDAGAELLRMDGRWDATPTPNTQLTVNDLLPKDFGIEEEQNVDIAFWDSFNHRFVAFNNDSWRYADMRYLKPGHDLGTGPITANIRLVGTGFDATFPVRFGVSGNMVKILN